MTTDTAAPDKPRFDLADLTGSSGSISYPGKVLINEGVAVEIGAGWTAGQFEIKRDDGDQKIAWVEGDLVAYSPGAIIQMVNKDKDSRRPLTVEDIGTRVSVNLSSGGAKVRLSEFHRNQGDYPDGNVVFAQGAQEIVKNPDGTTRQGSPPYQTGMTLGGVPVQAGDSGLPDIPDFPAVIAAMVRDGSAPAPAPAAATPVAPQYTPGASGTMDEAVASIKAAVTDAGFKAHLQATIHFCKSATPPLVNSGRVPDMDQASLENLWDGLYGVAPAFAQAPPAEEPFGDDEEPF